jgi:hypothetical protein
MSATCNKTLQILFACVVLLKKQPEENLLHVACDHDNCNGGELAKLH